MDRKPALRALIVLAVILVAPAFAAQATAAEEDTVVIEGAGWGHGVGMSQFGSQAMATDAGNAQTYDGILGYYFQDSTIGSIGADGVPALNDIFVSASSDQKKRTITITDGPGSSDTGVVVSRGVDDTLEEKELFGGEWLTVTDTAPQSNGGCSVEFSDGTTWAAETGGVVGSCDLTIPLAPDTDPPPYIVTLDSCRTTNCAYAWGTALMLVDNASDMRKGPDAIYPGSTRYFDGFDVVIRLSIDTYTRGIAEMPFSWHREALKAQAVAARSYAATSALRADHTSAGCFCDIGNSSADQVYGGWLGSRDLWESWDAAAAATGGRVVVHPSAPDDTIVRAFYSSSSGGATEASADKWGGSLPYLVSVPDPWSLTTINPYRSWTVSLARETLSDWLGVADVAAVEVIARNDSGSPRTFRFEGIEEDGSVVTVDKFVDRVRARFGLRSWYFSIEIPERTVEPPPPPPPPPPPEASTTGSDQVALQDPRSGIWYIRHADGTVDSFYYGNPKDTPYAGDWNGNGTDTMGLYRESAGYLFLRNTNDQGIADIEIYYGNPKDLPISGDWNGDGIDTVGIFRPSDEKFYLRNTNTQGIADISFAFGARGDVPIAGDWNGDGIDTIGVYRPSTKMVYLANDLSNPAADISFAYSGTAAGDRVIAGDWNGDGIDTIGVYRPSTQMWYLRDTFTQTSANIVFEFGEYYMNPTAGYWGD